jgi:hypothetical protein
MTSDYGVLDMAKFWLRKGITPKYLWLALRDTVNRVRQRDRYTERGQYFSERVYVTVYPDGKRMMGFPDSDDVPVGTLVAEYRFRHGQTIYKEEPRGATP